MRATLFRACDYVEAFFKAIGVLLFTIMIVAVFYEVVMRYVFNAPTFWAEPLARNAMIWMVLLGLAVGIRQKENICVDFIADRFVDPWRRYIAWVRIALVIAFASVLLVYGSEMAALNMRQTITGLDVPAGLVQSVVPVAALGMILFALELVAKRDWSRF